MALMYACLLRKGVSVRIEWWLCVALKKCSIGWLKL